MMSQQKVDQLRNSAIKIIKELNSIYELRGSKDIQFLLNDVVTLLSDLERRVSNLEENKN